MRVHPSDLHSRGVLEPVKPTGCCMSVHAAAVAVEQDRADVPTGHSPVDSARHCWRHRHEHDLVSFPDNPHNPVPVFLAEVADVQAGGLEDPQSEQAQQTHQREVVGVHRVAARGQHRLEFAGALAPGSATGVRPSGDARSPPASAQEPRRSRTSGRTPRQPRGGVTRCWGQSHVVPASIARKARCVAGSL